MKPTNTLPSPAGPWGSPCDLDSRTVSRAGGRDEVAMPYPYEIADHIRAELADAVLLAPLGSVCGGVPVTEGNKLWAREVLTPFVGPFPVEPEQATKRLERVLSGVLADRSLSRAEICDGTGLERGARFVYEGVASALADALQALYVEAESWPEGKKWDALEAQAERALIAAGRLA
jgi:hypothetical protein